MIYEIVHAIRNQPTSYGRIVRYSPVQERLPLSFKPTAHECEGFCELYKLRMKDFLTVIDCWGTHLVFRWKPTDACASRRATTGRSTTPKPMPCGCTIWRIPCSQRSKCHSPPPKSARCNSSVAEPCSEYQMNMLPCFTHEFLLALGCFEQVSLQELFYPTCTSDHALSSFIPMFNPSSQRICKCYCYCAFVGSKMDAFAHYCA